MTHNMETLILTVRRAIADHAHHGPCSVGHGRMTEQFRSSHSDALAAVLEHMEGGNDAVTALMHELADCRRERDQARQQLNRVQNMRRQHPQRSNGDYRPKRGPRKKVAT
jgi:hypothetical protein